MTNRKKQAQASYYLSRLEVYNWGGFSGFHKAIIDEQGTAIIGQTGSGKTTLIDALMTLLTARPSYNLASTGGHESDRDLMSYIRGSLGAGEGLETVARSGKTITALTAYFQPVSDGKEETQADLFSEDILQEQSVIDDNQTEIAIGVIYWLDSSSNSNSDRKDVWLVSEHHGSGLKDWLDCFLEGGSRGLKKWVKSEDNIDIYDSKKSYLAKIKRLFKVTDQAFTLLNKAVGLKQLNSVDEIFRKLVLDDVSSFGRAEQVIAQFDDLTQIKATLETAKRQQQSLNPLRKLYNTWQQQQKELADIQQMITTLPLWFAQHGQNLWQQRLTQLTEQLSKQQQQFQQVSNETEQQQIRYHSYFEKYHQQGGGELQQLTEQITGQKSLLAKTQKNYQEYQRLISNLKLPPINNLAEFNQQKQQIEQLNTELQQQIDKTQEQIYSIGAEKHTLQKDIEELQTQLQQANAQKSNIPLKFEQFKEQLAKYLQVDMGRLPYVAQLIEVQAEHSQWRGAIERALGSHRLRLLVPPHLMQSALHWVNQRNNHLHVRLYNAVEPEKSAQFFSDGFLRKLNFKQHELSEPLKQLLTNLDRHCVENTHDLENTAHAMTKEGLMSAKQGWYDKQDQKNLTADWLTGFDNKDLLQQINQQLNEKSNALHQVQEKFDNLAKQIRNYQQQQQQITILQGIDYSQIDCVTVENTLQKLQQRYDILNAPNSELSQLKHNYEQAQQQLNQLQQQVNNLQVAIQLSENDIDKAQQKQQQAINIVNKNKKPNPLIIDTLAKQYTTPTFEQIEELAQLEKSYHNQLIEQQNNVTSDKSKTENSLIRQMGKAKQQDTGALSEVGTELQDLEDYLQRLDYLTHEDLPSKQQRFIDYLNESSQASVSQLLKDIEYEVEKITDRIDSLNFIMKQVDFEHDKYLRLNAQKVVHTSLRQLQNAQRKLRAKALTTDNTDGEEHYQALQNLIAQLQQAVDKKHTLSAKALLDPRHRLTFSVSVMSRIDDSELEHRTGSQGGSGGEKEIIASHILTASLSYALSPTTNTANMDKMAKPKFSTIVLDEAFSKSSPKVATRIVEAIRAFGLHPLFVTPNKEMRLLRDHTRSAVLVVRKGNFANLLNCSWQQIDEVAQGNSA